MNKDNAKDYLPLVQALAEGKVIQVNIIDGEWEDVGNEVEFRFLPNCYRIKPEPRKAYLVWVLGNPTPYCFSFWEDAESFRIDAGGHIAEVME